MLRKQFFFSSEQKNINRKSIIDSVTGNNNSYIEENIEWSRRRANRRKKTEFEKLKEYAFLMRLSFVFFPPRRNEFFVAFRLWCGWLVLFKISIRVCHFLVTKKSHITWIYFVYLLNAYAHKMRICRFLHRKADEGWCWAEWRERKNVFFWFVCRVHILR